MRDRIADSMFQQLLLRPAEYSVIATPNLNGDYLSDAAAAQVGGLGIAPGGNVGDGVAVFEATHGTAPKYANLKQDQSRSVILSGVMMFEYMGWNEAAALIVEEWRTQSSRSASRTISRGRCPARQKSRPQGWRSGDRWDEELSSALRQHKLRQTRRKSARRYWSSLWVRVRRSLESRASTLRHREPLTRIIENRIFRGSAG